MLALILVFLTVYSSSYTGNNSDNESPDLGAYVISNRDRRPSLHKIITSLIGNSSLFNGNNEEEEEEYNSYERLTGLE